MLELLSISFVVGMVVAFIVFVFHNTNALYHYLTLPFIWQYFTVLRLQEYKEWGEKRENTGYYYPVFFRETYKEGFLTGLIGCNLCSCAFLCFITSLCMAYWVGTLWMLIFPCSGFFSLLLYFVLNKLKPE